MEPGVRHEVVRGEWPPTLGAIGPRVTSSLLPRCCLLLPAAVTVRETEDAGAEIERSPYPRCSCSCMYAEARPLRLIS